LDEGVLCVYWQEESSVYLLVLILNENLIVLIHKNPSKNQDFSKKNRKNVPIALIYPNIKFLCFDNVPDPESTSE
jgi:hypothetical protein